MNKLLTVYDDQEPLNNVISALTLNAQEIFFVYHHEVSRNAFANIETVIHKYLAEAQIVFLQLSEDEKQLNEILDRNPDSIIDVGAAKYLSLLLFEIANRRRNPIIYYDDEENVIKDYRTHSVLYKDVFKLKIEDVLKLRGGEIRSFMHQSASDDKTKETIIDLVEENIDNYPAFIRFLTKLNSIINGSRQSGAHRFVLDQDAIQKIKTDYCYKKTADLFEIDDRYLIFKTRKLQEMISVSGAFLENYLYILLTESGYFDDVLMSAEIDFSDDKYIQPVRCEIDCLVMRNNHLLFVSCKSSKAETGDLNEIYVHNSMFGNALSVPVLCVGEELDRKYPSIYAKAEELGIYIIDKSAFTEKHILNVFLEILDGTYVYDPLPL
ncbi:MAG: DUF1887 family protein [Erysipelotrichaceae bacterium]|nr:DUF1887 family protein [Erysipelotrichaceae bacterium]